MCGILLSMTILLLSRATAAQIFLRRVCFHIEITDEWLFAHSLIPTKLVFV